MTRTLHLIDGHSQVFRAYHAISGGLSTSTGIPTNATYGFINNLRALFNEEKPTHVIVVFDAGHVARQEMYAGYKATRSAMPADLAEQMPWIDRCLDALGMRRVSVEGCEADDVIGTLTRRAVAQGFNVAIVSNDKDLFQLVDENVVVLRTQPKGATIRVDSTGVRDKMGVDPKQVVDLLALMGDAVDCIPGVPGVGEKTAAKLLNEYGDLDHILEAAPQIKQNKLRQCLTDHADDARLSRRLAELDCEVTLDFDLEEAEWNFQPNPELTALLKQLEFTQLLDEWGEKAAPCQTDTETITTEEALRDFVKRARRAPLLALDTETADLDSICANLVGISMSIEKGTAAYVPVGHADMGSLVMDQLPVETVREILNPLLGDPVVPKVGHNIKYDLKVLRSCGFEVRGIAFDTLLASHTLNPDKRTHGLKDLSLERLGVAQTQIKELIGSGKSQITMAQVAIADASNYACQDADLTLRLANQLRDELEQNHLLDLYNNLEVPLIEVLADMEIAGVAINCDHFAGMKNEIADRLRELTKEIHTLAGHEFNIASTPQLRTVLFEELKLPVMKKTKTGASTDVEVLEALAADHPLPAKILEHRSLEKLLGTYVEALPKMLCKPTGRIHTTFHQSGAATGRLSSSDPNLQNIPVRTDLGRRIREGFVPRVPGNVLLAADYSQIELRIAAHLSQDPAMMEAFTRGDDIHRATAARVAGIEPKDVTSAQRAAAKKVTFGILYGISAHRLAIDLKITRQEGQAMIDEYFRAFAGVKAWIDKTLAEAREHGYVTTLLGRRRFISDIHSRNFNLRGAAERIAVNTPVQGSAADMIKVAMLRLARHLRTAGLKAQMVLQVHDELIFDLPESEVDTLRPIIVETMAGALPLTVPIAVDVAVGANWAEC